MKFSSPDDYVLTRGGTDVDNYILVNSVVCVVGKYVM